MKRGEADEEYAVRRILKKATKHAREDHNIKKVTKGYLHAWRMKIHDE